MSAWFLDSELSTCFAWYWEGPSSQCQTDYNGEGLQVQINKNTKRSPHHAMSFAAKRYVVTFLHNYAEENAILLPGRIPAYKRDDI